MLGTLTCLHVSLLPGLSCSYPHSVQGCRAADRVLEASAHRVQVLSSASGLQPEHVPKWIKSVLCCACDISARRTCSPGSTDHLDHIDPKEAVGAVLWLQGDTGKMSASVPTSSIFVSDSVKEITTKVNRYAFSGGGQTKEEHQAKGDGCSRHVHPDIVTQLRLLCGRCSVAELPMYVISAASMRHVSALRHDL
jgi:hypothetical protein